MMKYFLELILVLFNLKSKSLIVVRGCNVCSGLACKVSAGNDLACLTTNHLATLARLEPRLVPLVLAFRYWAQVWPTLTQLHFFVLRLVVLKGRAET